MQISGAEFSKARQGGIPDGFDNERDAFYANRRRLHAGFIYRTQETLCSLNALLQKHGQATITDNAIQNMCRLFDGDPKLPFILLQNPEPSQDESTFEKMADIATFRYLREKLQEVQADMPLEDIPVLDVFPLLTNYQLSRLQYSDRETATSLVFSITRDFIVTYKPSRIISMQCHTRQTRYQSYRDFRGDFLNSDAYALGSSLAGAIKGLEMMHSIQDHKFVIVSSRHPSGIWRIGKRGTSKREEAEHVTNRLFTSEFVTPNITLQYEQEKYEHYGSSLAACFAKVLDQQRILDQQKEGGRPLGADEIRATCIGEKVPAKETVKDLTDATAADAAQPELPCEASRSDQEPEQSNEISESSSTTPESESHSFRDKLRSTSKPEQKPAAVEDDAKTDTLAIRGGSSGGNNEKEHSKPVTHDLETQISKLDIKSVETTTDPNDGVERRGENGTPLPPEGVTGVKGNSPSESRGNEKADLPGPTAVEIANNKATNGKDISTTARIEMIRDKLADLEKAIGKITLQDKKPLVLTTTEVSAEKVKRPAVEVVPAA